METIIVVALFAGGTALGMASLHAGHGKNGLTSIRCPDEFFGWSLMIAAGRGSFPPDVDSVPGLKDFVSRRTNTFDAAALPADIPPYSVTSAEYHVYLIWAVAAVWRVFGVSWIVLEPFLAIGLGLCAVFAYGLFRLGMNRALSVAGTVLFISSPAVLSQLGSLRDFSKAPFLLAGILALGWLATRRTPQRFMLTATGLMGLVAGVGMGFRQDIIILVPASLAVILLLSRHEAHGSRRRRVMAALVFLAAFAAVAWPMLTRMEGGAQPYHPIAQGYSMGHMRRCSLDPGVCEPLACSHDGFIYDTALGYARRAAGDDRLCFGYNGPEAVRSTRNWVMSAALQFPADTLARVYGSTLNMTAGAGNYLLSLTPFPPCVVLLGEAHRHAAAFLHVAGPAFALLALLAAAAAGIRTGVVLLLIMLYFCGYVSLDNEWRHTFHLSFAAFWVAGLAAQCVITSAARTFAGTSEWGVWTRRAAVFALVSALAMVIPWQAAKVWQHRSLESLLRQYGAAPRTAVPTAPRPIGDWTLFRLVEEESPDETSAAVADKTSVKGGQADAPGGCIGIRRTLYAARFRARQNGRTIMTKYREESGGHDFSQLFHVSGTSPDGKDAWFFFPAYNWNLLNHFEGVAVPSEDAGDFMGLYAVDDKSLSPLLSCATVQEGQPAGRLCARILVPCNPMALQFPESDRGGLIEMSYLADLAGDANAALVYYRAYVALDPSCENLERRAALLHRAGRTGQAIETLELPVKNSGDHAACEMLDRFLAGVMPPEQRLKVWASLAPQCPALGEVWFYYGKALAGTDPDGAIKAFRTAGRLLPSDPRVPTVLQQSLIAKGCRHEAEGDIPAAIDAYGAAILANPANDEPCRRLAAAMPGGNPATAMILWDEVREADPTNAQVAVRCGAAHAVCNDLAGAREAFNAALRFGGENEYIYNMAGDAYAGLSAWPDAVAAYERALALNPGFDRQKLLTAAAFRSEQEGDTAGVVEACKKAILANPANGEPCWRLRSALSKESPAAARGLWEELRRAAPENAFVAVLCGAARAESLDVAGTREALTVALSLGGGDWNICDTAGDAYARIGAWSDAMAAYERALALNPGLDRQKLLLATAFRSEQEGDTAHAIKVLQKAILANPANGEPCWRLSAVLSKERPASAGKIWETLRQAAPENAFVAVLCGAARAADGDSAGACEALAAALRFGAGDWNICDTAGDAYASIGAWSDAVAAYGRASALTPGLRHQRLLIATGCRDEQEGDIPGAIDAYVKAILANPSNGEPYWRLDTAFPKTSPDAVAALWGGIWERVPENAAVDALYGESLAAANSPGPARNLLEAALRLGGNDCNVLARAGNAYSSLADWKRAVHCYERALALNPGMESLYPRLDDVRKRASGGNSVSPVSNSPA